MQLNFASSRTSLALRLFGIFGLPITVGFLQASVPEACLALAFALLANAPLVAALAVLGIGMSAPVLAMYWPPDSAMELIGATRNAYFGPFRGGDIIVVLITLTVLASAALGKLIAREDGPIANRILPARAHQIRIALACSWPMLPLTVPFGLLTWPAALRWTFVLAVLHGSLTRRYPFHLQPEMESMPFLHSTPRIRRDVFLLALFTAMSLLPFAWKPFHIDDPAYLDTAQQITRDPLDFYRFDTFTASGPIPMWEEMQNPPGFSYFLAAAGILFGWGELPMHAVEIVFAVAAVLGAYSLARRFCATASAAALAMFVTPAFYVSSTSVMCDVPMLAFYLWAAVLWLEAYDRPRHALLMASAVLIAAAALTKYFGMTLIPLLFVYSVVRSNRLQPRQLYLLIPVALLAAFEVWTQKLYGRGLLLGAGEYANGLRHSYADATAAAPLIGLLFIGGGIGTLAFIALAQLRMRALTVTVAGGAAAAIGLGLVADAQFPGLEGFNVPLAGLFGGAAIWLFVLAVRDVLRTADAGSLFLILWLAGTFAFAVGMNWSVTMRALLPAAPVAAIFVIRSVEHGWGSLQFKRAPFRTAIAIGLAVIPSAVIASTDARFAESDRALAATIAQEAHDDAALKFHGLWGFAWYMRQFGASPLYAESVQSGDHVALPHDKSPSDSLKQRPYRVLRDFAADREGPVRTMFAGAGFYSSLFGPLPYAIGPAPPNRFVLYLVTDSTAVANVR